MGGWRTGCVCAPTDEVDAGVFALRAPWGLDALAGADTIILPGLADPTAHIPEVVLEALRAAAEGGTRIADLRRRVYPGRSRTPGWLARDHALGSSERALPPYPDVDVDADVRFVDNGQILTSAGAAAGLDLCLHMIRQDHGSAVAADAARLAVMPLERDGGQAQYIVHEQRDAEGFNLEPLLRWMEENAHRELTLDDIATRATMSSRTLNRRFREQTGTTPLQWLRRSRIHRAQYLLETTGHSVERIALQVKFGSPTSFRDCFKRLVGTSPHAYRRAFRSSPAP